MSRTNRLRVVFNCSHQNRYAVNVIAGALESTSDSVPLEMVFAAGEDSLVAAIEAGLRERCIVLVGWSFYSAGFPAASRQFRRVSERFPPGTVVHVVGGVHATAEPAQTASSGFNIVAIGEGEMTIRELVKTLAFGGDYRHLKGVAFSDGQQVKSNGPGQRVSLDDFPPFAAAHGRFNPIEITRGCIYACKFCQTPFMFKARFRHRSVDNVCHYVALMRGRGLKDIRFISPTALSYGSSDESVRLDAIEELLGRVRETVGSEGRIFFGTFPSELRPEHVTAESLRLLGRFVSNNNLVIGGQSGSERVLALSHRGHGVAVIEEAARRCLEGGFLPNVDLIFGLPGEEPEDQHATLKLAQRLANMGARVHLHTFMPLPGTPFKNAPPGTIGPATLRQLNRLASRGSAYGQWLEQCLVARELAKLARSAGARRGEKRTEHGEEAS